MHNLHYPRNYYDQYEAFERTLLILSTFFYVSFSGADIVFSFNDMICYKSKKLIDLWTFSAALFTILYYGIYCVLLCFASCPNTTRLYTVRLRLSYTIYHSLQLLSNIALIVITALSFHNMCSEWFEMYMWSKLGVLSSISIVNLINLTFIYCYSDRDTRDLMYVTSRRG